MTFRMKKRLLRFWILCQILFFPTMTAGAVCTRGTVCYAQELSDSELYAQAAVLMDAESGRVLYGKNADTVLPMASTTKIMTCIVTLENAELDETVDISAYAASMPKVKLYVSQGESYVLRDLLYSLMLESHNDAAVAIAEHVGQKFLSGDLQTKPVSEFTTEESKQAVAAFAKLMNEKARDIGCENTWYITPNGLDATETFTLESGESLVRQHSTTAADLARVLSYCIMDSPMRDTYLEITGTRSYSFSISNGRSFSCVNHNAFLDMMEGALTGKTGFTGQAGYCYVGALRQDDRTYVVALLACGWPNNKTYKWSDTKKLMNYGLENYRRYSLSESYVSQETLSNVTVLNGQTDQLGQIASVGVQISERSEASDGSAGELSAQADQGFLLREDEKIEVTCEENTTLTAPVEAGEVVGVIEYRLNGELYRQEHIVLTESIPEIDFFWCLQQVWGVFHI